MADTHCVAEPLSDTESAVLRAYAEQDTDRVLAAQESRYAGGVSGVAWSEAAETLKARGFLQSHERGMLVTPEGLAAALM
jgi:hypothetical protein